MSRENNIDWGARLYFTGVIVMLIFGILMYNSNKSEDEKWQNTRITELETKIKSPDEIYLLYKDAAEGRSSCERELRYAERELGYNVSCTDQTLGPCEPGKPCGGIVVCGNADALNIESVSVEKVQ